MKRAIAIRQPTLRWLRLLALLVMGSVLYFHLGFAQADVPFGNTPTKLVPLPEKKVEAPPPVKKVEVPEPAPAPKVETCFLVKEETVTHSSALLTSLSDMMVRNCCCGGLTLVPGVFSYIQSPPTVTWSYKTVCQTL